MGITELLLHTPQVLVDVASALIRRIPLLAIVTDDEQRAHVVATLSDWGLPAHEIQFVSMPVWRVWVRDYGPQFVLTSKGQIAIVDAKYGAAGRANDDLMPTALAQLLDVPLIHAPLWLEGGNLLGNGRGFCLTTSRIVTANAGRGHDERAVQRILCDYYGFREGAVLEPLPGEPTQHVDMFATFVSPDTVVLAQCDPRNAVLDARRLDEHAESLSGMRTSAGRLNVVRVPVELGADGLLRTYTNVVYANGAVLVPQYREAQPKLNQQALSIYRDLLPGWEIIGINCSDMIRRNGALRCMSINIPWLTDRFPSPGSVVRRWPQRLLHAANSRSRPRRAAIATPQT